MTPLPHAHPLPTSTKPDRAFVPGLPGRLLSRGYAGVVAFRNHRFDAGRGVITLDRPVISVGNLSMGGTGKTPMVERIITLLREHGRDPAIAMRGYRSKAAGLSDEAELYKARFDDLPIVAQPKRLEGLFDLFNTTRGEAVDCIVLDDGFQHRRIARQLDLVLLDATQDPFACGIFPAGCLREPVENLARATHVAITHAELVSEQTVRSLARRVAAQTGGDNPCAVASHDWSEVTVIHRGHPQPEPTTCLAGKRVVAACAIGQPAGFLAAIERAHAAVVESVVLPDHDPFSPATIDRLCRAASEPAARIEAIVLTGKDWTKLKDRPIAWPCPVVVPRLELVFEAGWDALANDLVTTAATSPD